MEGPFDPQHPGQDAGASQPEAQDGDLHALLERLLGQGDVKPAAPGAGDDLWPDIFAGPVADEVSTIVPPPDAPTAVTELPTAVEEPAGEAGVELAPVLAWQPVVVDAPATTTNLDEIHAAILASVSVDLEPIVAAAPQPPPEPELDLSRYFAVEPAPPAAAAEPEPEPPSLDALLEAALSSEPLTADLMLEHAAEEPAFDDLTLDDLALDDLTLDDLTLDDLTLDDLTPGDLALALDDAASDDAASEDITVDDVTFDDLTSDTATASIEPAAAVDDEPAGAAFVLTPFEAIETDAFAESHPDADALWAAAVPELGLDVAPLLDLAAIEDEPLAPVAVVLPWRTNDPKPAEPTAPTAQDLIEAALSGLHADLTSEAVEPLRTPDVAASTAHVVFRLGARTMAIPLAAVSEIARPPKVTRLPHVPAWVLGIANLRGDIVSMLDLEGFLSGKLGKSSHEQRMLALRPAGDEVRTAVLVDSVDGIKAFEDARIARVTRGYDAEVAPYARGLYQVEDDLVVVLDADRLLQSKPMRQFEDGAGAR